MSKHRGKKTCHHPNCKFNKQVIVNLGSGPFTLGGHFTCKVHVTMNYPILTWEGKEQENKRMGIFHLYFCFIIVKENFPHADCLFSSRKRIPFKHGNFLTTILLGESQWLGKIGPTLNELWSPARNCNLFMEPSTQKSKTPSTIIQSYADIISLFYDGCWFFSFSP